MISIFHKTSFQASKCITQAYSTSFTLGIKTLSKELRDPIYGIYGFVRLADEIVDTFYDFNQKDLLEEFKQDTFLAIDRGISMNPVLQAFQLVVNKYQLDRELIQAFFKSMEMDLYKTSYGAPTYDAYIYGSAEVVGLMCLKVFVGGDEEKFNELKFTAQKLGAAFQKVNFLRDLQDDYLDRGRTYFPGIEMSAFNNESKKLIEDDIQKDFDAAYQGILGLPKSSRMGVYLAYSYYKELFQKIKSTPASVIQTSRVRVPDPLKFLILVRTYSMRYANML